MNSESSSAPHVLLITVDHWPASLLGLAGHPMIQTPTLDSLARNGVHYSNCYSECPVCIPARRTLMTGTPPRIHGDRTFQPELPMPQLPTMAQCFRDAGYQAVGVGKLHVFPQRNRIGFDDVILVEEGRSHWGVIDDYEIALGEAGHVGKQFAHGMSNNEYVTRPWHLPEELHVTNWITSQMSRTIRRRDPLRPGFWYLAYTHPHPPLVPLQSYLEIYRNVEPRQPVLGMWAQERNRLPFFVRHQQSLWSELSPMMRQAAMRSFYALCTHIDHQIRIVLGTLREEGILDNTIIMFTSDHGDMLGNHDLWAKRLFYEGSANVPMLLLDTAHQNRIEAGTTDDRLVGWQDIMPTLLEMAGISIPVSVAGCSMIDSHRRSYLYGECNEGVTATRMIHEGRYKLIYYAAGNRVQLFDLEEDPQELDDLSFSEDHQSIRQRLLKYLKKELYGSDLDWIPKGKLTGLDEPDLEQYLQDRADRGLFLQRGIHWPPTAKQN